MNKNSKIHEKFFCEIWKEKKFDSDLTTKEGDKVEILDSGVQNSALSGPDFFNSRIKIGNITYVGDVEIDSFHSDWKSHGHNLNKKYNRVILHAVFDQNFHHSSVFTQEGRKIPSISILQHLKSDLKPVIQKAILSEKNDRISSMPCAEEVMNIPDNEKLDFIYQLGVERFKKKCERYLHRLKEIAYLNELNLKEPVVKYELDENFHNRQFTHADFHDPLVWQQLFYESFFEALGYSKNKDIMQKLAIAADLKFITQLLNQRDFKLNVESALFNISGLMPDVYNLPDEETSVYTKKLSEIWSEIKYLYDGKTFHAAHWQFYKLRPQNFPTIRIAGGVILLEKLLKQNLIGDIIKKISQINDLKYLNNSLRSLFVIRGDGFWSGHYVFDQPSKMRIKYFVGASRADEILINVVYPIISLYFELFGKTDLAQKVLKLYSNSFQKNENHLVEEVSTNLQLNDAWKRSILYQGMIDLFRNFCTKGKCLECEIGKKVFEQ